MRLLSMLNRITEVGFILATVIGIATLVGVIGAVWWLLVT